MYNLLFSPFIFPENKRQCGLRVIFINHVLTINIHTQVCPFINSTFIFLHLDFFYLIKNHCVFNIIYFEKLYSKLEQCINYLTFLPTNFTLNIFFIHPFCFCRFSSKIVCRQITEWCRFYIFKRYWIRRLSFTKGI